MESKEKQNQEAKKASEIVEIEPTDHFETLRRCGGFYECPKDAKGNRLGPLVGYADPNFVGEVYVNFGAAEKFHHVIDYYAKELKEKIGQDLDNIDVFVGAPTGGYSLCQELGRVCDRLTVKCEKKVTELATKDSREKSKLIFGRQTIEKNEDRTKPRVAIVEDVCNNFSTTDEMIKLIESSGGKVQAIICFLNRSTEIEDNFKGIKVIPLVRKKIEQYRKDNPYVAEDVKAGNVALKPKDRWNELMATMNAAKS